VAGIALDIYGVGGVLANIAIKNALIKQDNIIAVFTKIS
jgi:hypothetical protein